jgi:hypothetical protein
MRSPTRIMAATTLTCEALVVIFAGLVAKDLSSLSLGAALGITSALAIACLLAAGMLRSRAGYVFGSVLQVLIFAFGFWVHSMFFIGVMFSALWIASIVMGERAKRTAEERWGPSAGHGEIGG